MFKIKGSLIDLEGIKKLFLETLKLKSSGERFSVGLDIGTSTIKLARLRFLKDSVQLCGFALLASQPELETALRNIIQSQEIKRVNISVSAPAAIIRYVKFPKMEKEELRQSLKFEAHRHIPFAISEVILDTYILRPDLPDNKMLVLMAAVKKDFLSQRLRVIDTAGLLLNVVDIDSLALVNAFNFNYSKEDSLKNKTVALLNIGASFSNLNILETGTPVLSRDIQIAGNSITQKIADGLGLDFKSAEELKVNPGKEKPDKVLQAAESVLSDLAQEVRGSFDYYESQNASSVAEIFLSGAGSCFTGLKDTLANLLGIKVEYWNPLRQMDISQNLDADKINSLSSQLAVVAGLGLRT
jgi:type IV pilus assembly protein PilM